MLSIFFFMASSPFLCAPDFHGKGLSGNVLGSTKYLGRNCSCLRRIAAGGDLPGREEARRPALVQGRPASLDETAFYLLKRAFSGSATLDRV